MLLTAMEIALWLLVALFIVTQVVYPFCRGTVMFPILRKEANLEKQLNEAKQYKVELEMQKELKKIQQQNADTEKSINKK